MFLRFLIAEGHCAVGLDAAIPTLAHWRLATLPRYLQPEEVERVIASCDRSSPVGRRDRAILLLLARLGLRAGDIVHLRLNDIDWKKAWIQVCGKGRRQTRLPLTQEMGQAIVAYLQNGRPRTSSRRGVCPLPCAFSCFRLSLCRLRDRRPGAATCWRGAPQPRRGSFAAAFGRDVHAATGRVAQDIAAVLRHRSIETTQIYAKVDVTALRQIAQPWPEVQPC